MGLCKLTDVQAHYNKVVHLLGEPLAKELMTSKNQAEQTPHQYWMDKQICRGAKSGETRARLIK